MAGKLLFSLTWTCFFLKAVDCYRLDKQSGQDLNSNMWAFSGFQDQAGGQVSTGGMSDQMQSGFSDPGSQMFKDMQKMSSSQQDMMQSGMQMAGQGFQDMGQVHAGMSPVSLQAQMQQAAMAQAQAKAQMQQAGMGLLQTQMGQMVSQTDSSAGVGGGSKGGMGDDLSSGTGSTETERYLLVGPPGYEARFIVKSYNRYWRGRRVSSQTTYIPLDFETETAQDPGFPSVKDMAAQQQAMPYM